MERRRRSICYYRKFTLRIFKFEPQQINPEYYCETEFQTHADELPVIEFSARADGETVPGHDFLTWLWYFSEQETGGALEVPEVGECAFSIEGPLTFALAGEVDGAAEKSRFVRLHTGTAGSFYA